jgi:ElaB/YqjD/DUF883 family membrane-anchored ribosome-binding protein
MNTEAIKPVSVETIKEDMQRLTDDFRKAMYFLGEKSGETVKRGSEKFGSVLKSLGESVRIAAGDAYERVSGRGKEAVEKTRRTIAFKPITYVLSVLAVGVLAGAFLKRS